MAQIGHFDGRLHDWEGFLWYQQMLDLLRHGMKTTDERNLWKQLLAFREYLSGRRPHTRFTDYLLPPGVPPSNHGFWGTARASTPWILLAILRDPRVYALPAAKLAKLLEVSYTAEQVKDAFEHLPRPVIAVDLTAAPLLAGERTYDFLVITNQNPDPEHPWQTKGLKLFVYEKNCAHFSLTSADVRQEVEALVDAGNAREAHDRLAEIVTRTSPPVQIFTITNLEAGDTFPAWEQLNPAKRKAGFEADYKALTKAFKIAVGVLLDLKYPPEKENAPADEAAAQDDTAHERGHTTHDDREVGLFQVVETRRRDGRGRRRGGRAATGLAFGGGGNRYWCTVDPYWRVNGRTKMPERVAGYERNIDLKDKEPGKPRGVTVTIL
jgi:hypothetical protein